jgi:hypothetical protein
LARVRSPLKTRGLERQQQRQARRLAHELASFRRRVERRIFCAMPIGRPADGTGVAPVGGTDATLARSRGDARGKEQT